MKRYFAGGAALGVALLLALPALARDDGKGRPKPGHDPGDDRHPGHVFDARIVNTPSQPVPVTGSVTGSVDVLSLPPVQVQQPVTVDVQNLPLPVSGSVAITNQPTVTVANPTTIPNPLSVTGTVAITANSPLPVMASGPKRYSVGIFCQSRTAECAQNLQIPGGKVFVIESVTGHVVSQPADAAVVYLAIVTPADQTIGTPIAVGDIVPTKSLSQAGVLYSFLNATTPCNLRAGANVASVQAPGATLISANLLLSGYIVDQ